MSTPELINWDRTRAETDWACPRRRYWAFEHAGQGLSPRRHALALDMGSLVHECLPRVIFGEPVETVAVDAQARLYNALRAGDQIEEASDENFAQEQSYLIAGMILGAARTFIPLLLEEYEPIHCELEIIYEHGPLRLMAKPDLLVRRRQDGALWYVEFKTSGIFSPKWFASWQRAPQIHLTTLAIERHLGEPLAGTIVQGLYKGYQRDGKQGSVFAYGYKRNGHLGDKWTGAGARAPIWAEGLTPLEWNAQISQEVLEAQFGQAPPVFLNRRLVSEFLLEREYREKEIREARRIVMGDGPSILNWTRPELVMRRMFPMHFNECEPVIGAPCPFRNLCFIPQMAADPLRSGEFVVRQPHHSTEELEDAA